MCAGLAPRSAAPDDMLTTAPPPARTIAGMRVMAAVDRAEQVELHRLVPHRRDIDLAERRILADRAARAIEQDVELAEMLFGRRDGGLHAGFVGHVGANEQRRVAQRTRQRRARLLVDIRDDDLRALAREQLRRRAADAPRAAA